jgi:hypothetical protein
VQTFVLGTLSLTRALQRGVRRLAYRTDRKAKFLAIHIKREVTYERITATPGKHSLWNGRCEGTLVLRAAPIHDPSNARHVDPVPRVLRGLWDEAIAPETTERVVPTGAEPARHAELEHEPELAVFENLVTIAHKSPNAANEPRANGIAVCESGDRRERTRFAC